MQSSCGALASFYACIFASRVVRVRDKIVLEMLKIQKKYFNLNKIERTHAGKQLRNAYHLTKQKAVNTIQYNTQNTFST